MARPSLDSVHALSQSPVFRHFKKSKVSPSRRQPHTVADSRRRRKNIGSIGEGSDSASSTSTARRPIYVIGFAGKMERARRGGEDMVGPSVHRADPRMQFDSSLSDPEVGTAFTTDDFVRTCPVHGHQTPASLPPQGNLYSEIMPSTATDGGAAASSGAVRRHENREGPVELAEQRSQPTASLKETASPLQNTPGSSAQAAHNRVFGLTKNLAAPSADSAHLPPAFGGVGGRNHPHLLAAHSSRLGQASTSSGAANPASGEEPPTSPLQEGRERPAGRQRPATGQISSTSNIVADEPPTPQFSVEVVAPSFDKRGYPIFAGRAARIRGVVRMRAIHDCEVVVHLGAHVSQGSPAAIWDGIALMPPESGEDRSVFSTDETIKLQDSMLRRREGASPTSTSRDDMMYEIPFDTNLPLGMSTRFVNGQPSMTAVSLPPSYEVSSDENQRERDALRAANSALKSSAASIRSKTSRLNGMSSGIGSVSTGIGNSVQSAVEKGFGEVFRIGCFYNIRFVLQRNQEPGTPTGPVAALKSKFGKTRSPRVVVLDTITVPFIFLGEPSPGPMPPHSIPRHLIAPAIVNATPGPLSEEWEIETSSAKWSGTLLRTAKRNVELELHMPSPPTLQAPCLFPVLLIIRPTDPLLLAAVPHDGVPPSPLLNMRSQMSMDLPRSSIHRTIRSQDSRVSSAHEGAGQDPEQEMLDSQDDLRSGVRQAGPGRHNRQDTDGMLSRFMRSGLNISRKKSTSESFVKEGSEYDPHSRDEDGNLALASPLRSTFGVAISGSPHVSRPNTAPTSGGSSSGDGRSRTSGSMTAIGPGGTYFGNLSGLVRISLVQTTYCVGSGPSDTPKNLRRLISMAEVEELDLDSLFSTADSEDNQRPVFPPGPETDALRQSVHEKMQDRGVRVLKGTFRIGTDATPSFRCQGIEVKYGIKVDLVPFAVKESKSRSGKRRNSGGTLSSGSGGIGSSEHVGAPPTPRPSISSAMPPLGSPSSTKLGSIRAGSSTPMAYGSPPSTAPGGRSGNASASVVGSGGGSGSGGGQGYGSGSVAGGAAPSMAASTIIAERAGASDKLEKGVGALFATVRMVRGSLA